MSIFQIHITTRTLTRCPSLLGGGTNLCPRCRTDLTEHVRGHLSSCGTLPSEIKQRAREVREAAQMLIKRSQELSDESDVLILEDEARLFESQRAPRRAMSRSKAS